MSYTKLFSSLTASTIWNAPDHTRLVWITMLAMVDRDGYVAASVPGLAVLARVPIQSVIIALESFCSPDEWSRTKDNEGRRIEERDGGWLLLNYHKYKTTDDIEHVRQKTADRTRRYRENKKRHGDATVTPVTQNHPIAAPEAAPEPEAETHIPRVPKIQPGIVSQKFRQFWDRWVEVTGRRQKEAAACQAFVSVVEFETEIDAMTCLERYGESDEVGRGIVSNPDKWLYEQARDGFRGEWPTKGNSGNGIVAETMRYLNEHPD